jgi:hypothetical protein
MNLSFFSSKSAEKLNRTMIRNIHSSCDIQSFDESQFSFFEMSRIGELNYLEKYSFIMWYSITWWISVSFLRNEQNRWTELSWEIFIHHVIFNHLMNLSFFSSKSAEKANRTMLGNIHSSCDIQSPDESQFLFFEMSKAYEKNYARKYSFVMWYSITWWISVSFLRNEQNRWTELSWEIFIHHVIFNHLMNLSFFSSKSAEKVNRTMLGNIHSSCDIQSFDESHFLFFEKGRISEQNYVRKYSFVM